MTRRIVTGNDPEGLSTIVSDGEPPVSNAYRSIPGFKHELVWRTGGVPVPEREAVGAPLDDYLPGPGESIAVAITFPPAAVFGSSDFDPELAAQEDRLFQPGFIDTFEADAPGMHTTPSVDYVTVLEGELELELDGGKRVAVGVGDVIVQNATRHAWRNETERPARILAVLIGTER